MVDIGLGQMERTEFIALKQMVQGRHTGGASTLVTPIVRLERYGMLAMASADFIALRDKVDGRGTGVAAEPTVMKGRMVDIGTGEMAMDEFIALKRMLEGADFFQCDHLAASQPARMK
jgi:hypothetical protein